MKEVISNLKRMKENVKLSLDSNYKPNIDKFISDLWYIERDFSTFKIKETQKLDEMVYCLINLLKEKYNKIKYNIAAINKKTVFLVKKDEIYNEIKPKGLLKIKQIDNEIDRFRIQYPDSK
ncbi:MAG: hypothetical protein ABI707_09430 [Ferruginibacter sp.]